MGFLGRMGRNPKKSRLILKFEKLSPVYTRFFYLIDINFISLFLYVEMHLF